MVIFQTTYLLQIWFNKYFTRWSSVHGLWRYVELASIFRSHL